MTPNRARKPQLKAIEANLLWIKPNFIKHTSNRIKDQQIQHKQRFTRSIARLYNQPAIMIRLDSAFPGSLNTL